MSTAVPTAGWFPDPGDPAQERWWSGDGWTEHHRPAPSAEPAQPEFAEPAMPEFVFSMATQTEATHPEAAPDAALAAATPAAADKPVESAEAPAEPVRRLPTFEELLAAAAAPAPADEAVAVDPAPPAETWTPKSYGAPAEPVAPAASVEPVQAVLPPAPTPAAPAGFAAAAGFIAPTSFAEPAPTVEPVAVVASVPPAVPPSMASLPPVAASVPPAMPSLPPIPAAAPAPAPAAPAAAAPVAAPIPAPTAATTLPAPPPAPAPAAPVPAPAGFVLPTQAADPGLVMPSAPILENPAPRAETARHAEVVPEVAPPTPAAPPAPAPVGYTASADPAIANRYRQALHNPEPTLDETDAPVMGPYPTAVATSAGPSQPGWQGLPLPGPGASYATAPAGYAPQAEAGTNKIAWSALTSGAISLGLTLLGVFVTDRIGLWPAILAIAAIVQGIIGAVRFSRTRRGLGAAIGGMLLGLATLGLMGAVVVLAMLVLGAV